MALRQEQQIEPELDHFVRSNARPLLAYRLRRAAQADAHDATAEVRSIAWRKRDGLPDGDHAL